MKRQRRKRPTYARSPAMKQFTMIVKHLTLCSVSKVSFAYDLAMAVDDIMKENVSEDPASPTIWSRWSQWDKKKIHSLDAPQAA